MPILEFFKPKDRGPEFIDKIYVNRAAKDRAVIKMAIKKDSPTFLVWSESSYQYYHKLLDSKVSKVSEFIPSRLSNKQVVFIEHHFSREKELEFLKSLNLNKAVFIISLDDEVFHIFNSDKIQETMRKMSHNEDEPLEHKMISKSIEGAQKKLVKGGLPEDCDAKVKAWYKSLE